MITVTSISAALSISLLGSVDPGRDPLPGLRAWPSAAPGRGAARFETYCPVCFEQHRTTCPDLTRTGAD